MLHAELFRRCAGWGRWLLAAGLVLGWSGEAQAQADLALSVNPNTVREDAGSTAIDVTVEVTDDTAVDVDTYVLLNVSNEGLNNRFRVRLTSLRIPAGEKKTTGTLTIIPINDREADADLSIEIRGNAGSKTVQPTTITLIDDDKDSQEIWLSADIVELNRFDGATEIAVTATLDGKALNRTTSFPLTIGDHPALTAAPNSDTNGDDQIDEDDATADNREAQRDLDYRITLATITIPPNSVSGTARIIIAPNRRLPGTIRLEVPDRDAGTNGIQIAVGGLTVRPVDIKIKKELAATADTVTLSQESIREDAGETTIELNVTLTNALIKDEVVQLILLSEGEPLPSGGTVSGTPIRDVHYTLAFGSPAVVPAGATEVTTTFTLTPRDDNQVAERGSIYIQVRIGSVSVVKTIALADDDANSTRISLAATPTAISEGAGSTNVVVTGTLNGKALGDDLIVLLTVDPDPKDSTGGNVVDVVAATRDIDYRAVLRALRIPAGALSGSATITITPVDDQVEDSGEKIRLTVPYANKQIPATGADGERLLLTVGSADITLRDAAAGSAPSFATDAIEDQSYTVGEAIASLVLPAATGGDGSPTYSISSLPAGLFFDSSTRTLLGTPTAATNGAVAITYMATDSDGDVAALTFTITATAAAVEEDETLAFAAGASIPDQTYTVGVAIPSLVLPVATGADCALTYGVSSLPAGLFFDSSARTLLGTPTEATDGAVAITYTATDNDEVIEAVELTFSIAVNPAAETPTVMAAGLTASPAVVGESAGATAISLTFSLAAASATNEAVLFSIVEPSSGPAAVRDVDFAAALEALVIIPAGATEATTTLTLTPIDDDANEGPKALGAQVLLVSTGEVLVTDIEIKDDEAPSTAIVLSANPSTLSEQAALTVIVVTATLDGQPLEADATVRLAIGEAASTATRNLDYAALFTPSLEIPAGSITGTMRLYIDPITDDLQEGDEVIKLVGTIGGLRGDEVEITIRDAAAAKAVVQPRPAAFALGNNYPNPFNPSTTIRYALPQASAVELTVYNMGGQAVRTLVSEHQSAGRYAVEWDATNDSGQRLSSGVYFYHLQVSGQFHDVKKMLLLK